MEQKVVVLVGQNQGSLLNVCLQYTPVFIPITTCSQSSCWKYTWDDFKRASLIVDCGGWDYNSISGIKPKNISIITWSGDDLETVQRILRILQSG